MSFTDIIGFCILAELQYGSNGEASGASECDAGKSLESESTGRRKWAVDTSDGVDSGWVPVQLVVNADSSNSPVAWLVNGADPDPIAYTGATFGEILYFKLQIHDATATHKLTALDLFLGDGAGRRRRDVRVRELQRRVVPRRLRGL